MNSVTSPSSSGVMVLCMKTGMPRLLALLTAVTIAFTSIGLMAMAEIPFCNSCSTTETWPEKSSSFSAATASTAHPRSSASRTAPSLMATWNGLPNPGGTMATRILPVDCSPPPSQSKAITAANRITPAAPNPHRTIAALFMIRSLTPEACHRSVGRRMHGMDATGNTETARPIKFYHRSRGGKPPPGPAGAFLRPF